MTIRFPFILPVTAVAAAALLLGIAPAEAASEPAAPAGTAKAAPPAAVAPQAGVLEGPAIEPSAMEALKKMSDLLKGAASLSFSARTVREQRIDSGQMLDFFVTSKILMTRPNRARIDASGPLHSASLWYNGKTATIYGRKTGYYAQTNAPPTIDETITMLLDRFETPLPVAGFLLKDPYARMMEGVKAAFEIGPAEVDGAACRHLAFSEEEADWQVWIEVGPKPLPRMIAVLYKKLDGAPRVTTTMSDWNLSPKIAADEFTFKAPEGAKKVDWATAEK